MFCGFFIFAYRLKYGMTPINIPAINLHLAPDLLNKINQKTKPLGALGSLEKLALQIGQIQNTLSPKLIKPTMLVFAGDHGITEAGVSAFPQAVTAQMVMNFLRGGAAINVFANQQGMALKVVDSGVNHDFGHIPNLINAKVALGTANFLDTPAMTEPQCEQALTTGMKLAKEEIENGSNVMGFGEMGIGNTSSASCLMSVLCGLPISKCVGRGTGLDDDSLVKKVTILQKAITKHQLENSDPMKVLATFGGFEIAMMTGAMLGAAQSGAVLLIDGFIATSALLVAAKLQPNILQYCIFSHCSDESGHQWMLEHLKAKPLLNLNLRLGEGTGAVLAYPLVLAAVNFMNEMASFESAGVSQGESGI
jgi:nicotinate-nucleotide--dimethylbenzimidazole phosphoribosyltransferase